METAIKAMKDGKARGVYSLQAELLKADTTTAFLVPNNLFAKIWNHEVILENKSMDHVLKIPKKGDLGNCDSWNALLSIRIPRNVRAKLGRNRLKECSDIIFPLQVWSPSGLYFLSTLVCSNHLLAIHETNLIPSAWNPVDLLSHLQGLYFADYLTVMSDTLVICRNNSTS